MPPLLLLQAAALAVAAPASGHHITAQLVASTERPRPGSVMLVGFAMKPQPGWHGYWTNPGESGLAPTVQWTAPSALHFGALQHPAPTILRTMGLTSFVHAGDHMLISRVRVDGGLASGAALPVKAELSWAACSDRLCVPEHATLALSLTAGDGRPSAAAPRLARAAAREPRPAPAGSFRVAGAALTLELPPAARLAAHSTRFFPDRNGVVDVSRATLVSGAPIRLAVPLVGKPPADLTGVVTDGARSYRLRFEPAATPQATPAEAQQPVPPASAVPAVADPQPEPIAAQPMARLPQDPRPPRRLNPLLALGLVAAFAIAALLLARSPYR